MSQNQGILMVYLLQNFQDPFLVKKLLLCASFLDLLQVLQVLKVLRFFWGELCDERLDGKGSVWGLLKRLLRRFDNLGFELVCNLVTATALILHSLHTRILYLMLMFSYFVSFLFHLPQIPIRPILIEVTFSYLIKPMYHFPLWRQTIKIHLRPVLIDMFNIIFQPNNNMMVPGHGPFGLLTIWNLIGQVLVLCLFCCDVAWVDGLKRAVLRAEGQGLEWSFVDDLDLVGLNLFDGLDLLLLMVLYLHFLIISLTDSEIVDFMVLSLLIDSPLVYDIYFRP